MLHLSKAGQKQTNIYLTKQAKYISVKNREWTTFFIYLLMFKPLVAQMWIYKGAAHYEPQFWHVEKIMHLLIKLLFSKEGDSFWKKKSKSNAIENCS